jgi:hypothetical protein
MLLCFVRGQADKLFTYRIMVALVAAATWGWTPISSIRGPCRGHQPLLSSKHALGTHTICTHN